MTRRGAPWLGIYVAVIGCLVLLPTVVVILSSLTADEFIAFPPTRFSFRWYQEILADPDWAASLQLSAMLAICVTLAALALGVPAALALHRMRGAGAVVAQNLLLSPLMVPTIVLGLALLRLFTAIGVPLSATTIVLGQTVIAIPYVVRLVLAQLHGLDPALERAASILGAGALRVFWRITLPLIRQGVMASGLFCIIVSLDDVNVALFLSDVRTTPLSVRLFGYILQNADPLGAAASSLLIVIVLALMLVCDRIVGIDWLLGIKRARS